MAEAEAEAKDLDYPASDWKGFFKKHFGPSMLWALISIGGSHIVLAPTLGGHFGLLAIWMFGLIYLVKYGAWELGIRYNYGAGGNPIEAYDQLPGPKNWALWLTIGIFTIAYTGLVAAVGVIAIQLAAFGLTRQVSSLAGDLPILMIQAAGATVALMYLFAVIGVFVDRKLAARGLAGPDAGDERARGRSR
jgi:hypothetical protein